MAALIVDLRRAYPQLVGKLPCVADGCACFSNEKARWFYHNRPGELKWEHARAIGTGYGDQGLGGSAPTELRPTNA